MEIILIRHGETSWNVERRLQGNKDISLNENGFRQAKERAKYFLNKKIIPDKIFCSNKIRAKQTAQVIAKKFFLDVFEIEGIEEISFGNWEGYRWDDLTKYFEVSFEEWNKNKKTSKSHGGENYIDVKNRVIPVLKNIYEKSKESDTIFVVTHGAIIMTILLELKDKNWKDTKPELIPENLGYVTLNSEEIEKILE
ncbi:MAG: histidine phosphatase family protein [Peptoniphilaceae bacterium]|uniref:histidine phosphatase family protein n=1 Tax=Parvimonas sp. TaxID=1944660 RepID=UPI0025D2FC7A|nr:histidine phosphatase family protein [Parvimonas sp.]MCI5996818.1 histidine phosphatase family protein [Parvimonas sp.]MDD7764797.1 histidine phosphatase family protein [Peptoniphilaceae bacterium]MDY3050871.1 histidine phosphatase family protein [Parvimonas sp.]